MSEPLFKTHIEDPDPYQTAYEMGEERCKMGLDYVCPFGDEEDARSQGFYDGYHDYSEDEEDSDW